MQSTWKEKQRRRRPGLSLKFLTSRMIPYSFALQGSLMGLQLGGKRETKIKENHEMQMGSTGNDRDDKAHYCSRLLACARCGTEQETKDKQTRVKTGFRAITCKKCGKQERVHSNMCRCNVIWHHCPIHRIDPPHHNIGENKKKLGKGEQHLGNKTGTMNSTRAAPFIEEASPQPAKKPALMRSNLPNQGRMLEMQMRVREKEAKRKHMDDESVSKKKNVTGKKG